MEYIPLIGTIISIHVLAWLTPWPLVILILRNSLIYSRKVGIGTSIGIAIGNFIHISYSILLANLLLGVSWHFIDGLKIFGSGYLIYLGIKTWKAKPVRQKLDDQGHTHEEIGIGEAIRMWLIANLLSPKASLFFVSIFASLIALKPPFWVVGFLWCVMPLNSCIMAVLYSVLFSQKQVQRTYAKYQSMIHTVLALFFLLLAGFILLS